MSNASYIIAISLCGFCGVFLCVVLPLRFYYRYKLQKQAKDSTMAFGIIWLDDLMLIFAVLAFLPMLATPAVFKRDLPISTATKIARMSEICSIINFAFCKCTFAAVYCRILPIRRWENIVIGLIIIPSIVAIFITSLQWEHSSRYFAPASSGIRIGVTIIALWSVVINPALWALKASVKRKIGIILQLVISSGFLAIALEGYRQSITHNKDEGYRQSDTNEDEKKLFPMIAEAFIDMVSICIWDVLRVAFRTGGGSKSSITKDRAGNGGGSNYGSTEQILEDEQGGEESDVEFRSVTSVPMENLEIPAP